MNWKIMLQTALVDIGTFVIVVHSHSNTKLQNVPSRKGRQHIRNKSKAFRKREITTATISTEESF